jgi:hypothetical protein
VITGDTVNRGSAGIDAASKDKQVQAARTFLQRMTEVPRLSSTAVETAGEKRRDSFAPAIVDPT